MAEPNADRAKRCASDADTTGMEWKTPAWPPLVSALVLALPALGGLGCSISADAGRGTPPVEAHVPEGNAASPTVIEVLFPSSDLSAIRHLVSARPAWEGLQTESLALSNPRRYPQPDLDPAWIEAGTRALDDLLDPLVGLTWRLGPTAEAVRDPSVSTLVLVEILPDSTIRRLHGSDAFTESFYEYETKRIRRAIIHLPMFLLDHAPDDFANFLGHEFGHALGQEAHLEEMSPVATGDAWFWDRLMTIPICMGQRWQPATIEDVLLIATGRYTLRAGWDAERAMRFGNARAYRPTRADLALAEQRWARLAAAARVDGP
jgi:hypothetical protein